MSIPLSAAAICFIACHGGPAEHFATFAESLLQKGYAVEIYAAGPALKKLEPLRLGIVKPFSLEGESAASELAQKCSRAKVIITDVGHAFDIALQNSLAIHAVRVKRLAYYDNPEPYVPGGYSSTAAKVMKAAQGVLFANSNLSTSPIYAAPGEEIALAPENRAGIGYYPVTQAEKIAKRREAEQALLRKNLFAKYSVVDLRQKVLVYAGGNNEEYFSKALPAFLQFMKEASCTQDLSNYIVLLQQHPGAKETNRDVRLVKEWVEQHADMPQVLISDMSSEDAQVAADAMLYYQTSMGPQFILAGIPTMQIGHDTYEDLLVKNQLCPSITDAAGLIQALSNLQKNVQEKPDLAMIYQRLGIFPDFADRLAKQLLAVIP